jgi:protein-disulfide isomerase
MKNQKIILASVGLVVLLTYFAGSHFFKADQNKKLGKKSVNQSELFERDHSPTFGNKNAKVTIVEFLDPECETCRTFYPLVKKLISKYPDQVRLVIRYTPFHKNSKLMVRILEASRKQGQFWPTLETLFRFQPNWGSHHNPRPELVWDYLPLLGLDIEKIKKDMNDPAIQKIIDLDISDGKELQVQKTPTFFINRKRLERFGYDQLKIAVESAIKE